MGIDSGFIFLVAFPAGQLIWSSDAEANANPRPSLFGRNLPGAEPRAGSHHRLHGDARAGFGAQILHVFTDYNGDGVVTDIDILLAVYDKVYAQPITDLDNDGVVTAADGLLSIRQVVISTMSDPNGDGQVSLDDALIVAAELNKQFPDLKLADTNGDGQLTLDDFIKVLDDMDGQLQGGDMPMDLAQAVFAEMGWAVEVGIENLRLMAAAPHNVLISSDWQTPDGTPPGKTHTKATSQAQWPANHFYSVSVQWREGEPNRVPPVPGHTSSTSTEWPANHSWTYSRTWTRPDGTPYEPYHHYSWISEVIPSHTRDISQDLVPAAHHYSLSRYWPAEHQGSFTRLWPNPHQRNTSMQWPANHIVVASLQTSDPRLPEHTPALSQLAPPTHQTAVSASWPSSHLGNISKGWGQHTSAFSQGYPPNHLMEHSASWDWDTHVVHQSAQWPPNHVRDISRNWMGHQVANSISWPATHSSAVSTTWVPPGYRGWPPNHDIDVSKSWHAPGAVPPPLWNPPTQIFPAGHSWMTTLFEVVPRIPIPRPPSN